MYLNKETSDTWNKIASLYEAKFMDLDLYNATYDFICNSITKDTAKILEIGCGPGNITKYLLSKRPEFKIHGIDIASNMIELARKNNPSASFNVMDGRQISRFQTKFDGIICGFCIPYLSPKDSTKLISDACNLLTDNGLLYLSFVEGDQIKSGYHTGSSGDKIYFYYHSLNNIKDQLITYGFEDIKIFKVPYKKTETEVDLHTIATARKRPFNNAESLLLP